MTTHALSRTADHHAHHAARYRLAIANSPAEVVAAQRLRHQVFAGEYGAITPGPVGMDSDAFDEYCDHLLVWFQPDGDQPAEVVATYRLLRPRSAAPGRYTETEFDLTAIAGLLPFTVETGRSCVQADHRNGATMALLWGGIAAYMLRGGYRYLLGCASVPLTDGGGLAVGVWEALRIQHCAPLNRCCPPLRPWRPDPSVPVVTVALPSLIRGYVRLGATVLGPPAHDPVFNSADFPILLDLQTADQRYLTHFLGKKWPSPDAAQDAASVQYHRAKT